MKFLGLYLLALAGSSAWAAVVIPASHWDARRDGPVLRDLAPLDWVVVENTNRRAGGGRPDARGWFAAPNDPDYEQQWHLPALNAEAAWAVTQGRGARIALVDSGVIPDHPDLAGALDGAAGFDFGDQDADPTDELGHGTLMAGLIAARCENGLMVCGIAPQATLIPYKINPGGASQFEAAALAQAILAAAASDADIINLSLVLPEAVPWVEEAVELALARGKIVVAATGNEGGVAFPARLPGVIAVGALGRDGEPLFSRYYSGDGDYADTRVLTLTAPGNGLYTTDFTGGTFPVNQTSSGAAALTSGVLALWAEATLARGPALAALVVDNSEDAGDPGFDPVYGFGRLRIEPQAPAALHLTATAPAFFPGEALQLSLSTEGIAGQSASVYLRLSLPPTQNLRDQFYFQLGSGLLPGKTSVHFLLQDPLPFDQELTAFPLAGPENALLGAVEVTSDLPAGLYEMLVEWKLEDRTAQGRKVIWLESRGEEKNDFVR